MSTRSYLAVLVLLLVCSCALVAQDYRATITGLVTDPSGAAIPGATVKATNITNNISKEVQSTSSGLYTIPFLEPGVYTIEATVTGFQTLKREQIVLRVADRINMPLQLTVGNVATEITVVGQQELLETASADRGLVFDPVKTQQYPLNGRQTYMLLMLSPGVIFTQEGFGASGFSGTRGWDVNGSYRFGAARSGGNVFLLNGANITDTGGTWQLALNVEAVQEFKVMINTYDASYGLYRGGVVNTTSKSGGNKWHGDVFEYWRNTALGDANYFQNKALPNADGSVKKLGLHNQHQFGGIIGGPIRKDKDFVFGSFEGWQEIIPYSTVATAPPMALRDGQHFTQYGVSIFDPLTRRYCDATRDVNPLTGARTCTVNNSNRTYVSEPFPNNAIPAARISPIGQKILAYWPNPNAPGDTNGLSNNYLAGVNPGRYYYEQPTAKWDHVFSDKDKLYAFFSWQQGYEFRSSNFPDRTVMGSGNIDNERHDQNVIVDWTRVMSPTRVLDVQLSYGRFVQTTPGYTKEQLAMDYHTLGIKNLPVAGTYGQYSVFPHVQMGGGTSIFGSGNTFYWAPTSYYQFQPSLSMTKGKHSLKVGFQYRYYMAGSRSSGATSGTLSFQSGDTQRYSGGSLNGLLPVPAGLSTSQDGSGTASMLLGVMNSGSIVYNDSSYGTRPFYSMYVQDDWKVTPKLSLNLGLRYDIQTGTKERYGRATNRWDWTYKNPQSDAILANWATQKTAWDSSHPLDPWGYPAVPKNCCYGKYVYPQPGERLTATDWFEFGPRVGVAYRVLPKTVIRSGIGLYFETSAQSTGTASMFSTTTDLDTTAQDGIRNRSAVAGLTGPYSLENPFPLGQRLPPQRAFTGIMGDVGFANTKWHGPASWQYSFTIQRELPWQIQLEVGFNGTYTNHMTTSYNYNRIGGGGPESWAQTVMSNWYNTGNNTSTFAYTGRTLPNPFYGVAGLDPLYGNAVNSTIGASDLLRPNPAFGSITENSIQAYHYRGDQLTLKVEKRAMASESKGMLTWVFSFAWAKAYSSTGRPFGDFPLVLPANFSSYPGYKQGMGSGLNSENSGKLLDYRWAQDSGMKPFNTAFSGVYDFPLGPGKKFANTNKFSKNVFGDWRFNWTFDYVAGNAIGYPSGFNYCGTWASAKKDEDHWYNNRGTTVVAGDPLRDGKSCYGPIPSGATSGYLYEQAPGYGVIPYYNGYIPAREPQAPTLNIALEKTIKISERYSMSIRGESFNATNTPIRNSVQSSTYTSSVFGVLNKTQKNFPRFMQIAAKFYF